MRSVTFGAAVFGAALLAGCTGESGPPLTTDGPNQVLFKVPGMS